MSLLHFSSVKPFLRSPLLWELDYIAIAAYSNDNAALEEATDKLRQENSVLQTTQKKMEVGTVVLQRQYNEIQTTNRQLNQTVTSLQGNVHNLQNANQELTEGNQQLQNHTKDLEESNKLLQQQVSQLGQAALALKNQLALFVDQNVILGSNLNILDINKKELDEDTKQMGQKIEQLDMTFNGDILKLSEEIQRAKTVSSQLFKGLALQKENLQKEVKSVEISTNNLKATERKFRATTPSPRSTRKSLKNVQFERLSKNSKKLKKF